MDYLVIDTKTRNVLGEFQNLAQARSFFLEFVGADPNAAPDLKIMSKAGQSQKVPAKSIREAASNKSVSAQLVG